MPGENTANEKLYTTVVFRIHYKLWMSDIIHSWTASSLSRFISDISALTGYKHPHFLQRRKTQSAGAKELREEERNEKSGKLQVILWHIIPTIPVFHVPASFSFSRVCWVKSHIRISPLPSHIKDDLLYSKIKTILLICIFV